MRSPSASQKLQPPADEIIILCADEDGPDWEQIEHTVACPLCDYNLRGLNSPRCPECGFVFKWREVLDPTRQKHQYLFEHHPEDNLWSWWRTMVGGLWPKKFWTTLHPAQPSRPWRLLIYALIIIFIASLPLLIERLIGSSPASWLVWYGTRRGQLAMRSAGSFPLDVFMSAMWMAQPSQVVVFAYVIATMALPLGTLALLMIFQGTMRKVRVKQRHVLRCIVYSADVLIWPAIVLVGLVCAAAFINAWSEAVAWTAIVMFPLVWAAMAWRLASAYQHYLRFDHPRATVLSVQLILFIIWLLAGLTRWL